jgi:adenylate cyclase class IV
MELEAKLTLRSLEDLNKVAAALMAADSAYATEQEEDQFFDSPNADLEKAHAVFRIRSSTRLDGTRVFKATLKEHSSVGEGSSVRWQHDDVLDATTAAAVVQEPTSFLRLPTGTAKALSEKFQIRTLMKVGAISTHRMIFKWQNCVAQPGLTIRLDCTTFPFGKSCEIEVPHVTVPVGDVLTELSQVLQTLGVASTLARESKYEQLRRGTREAAAHSHMVMEAKLALATEQDYRIVRNALSANLVSQETHDNWFLDGPERQLGKRSTMLRIRLDSKKSTCVATIKEHTNVEGGSSLCWAQEETIPYAAGQLLKSEPNRFYELEDSNLVKTLQGTYKISQLKYVGGFSTLRELYSWPTCVSQPGLMIRLDHTTYPFGARFELEVPHIKVPVEDVVNELSTILTGLGAKFTMGKQTKFEQFHDGMAKAFLSETF